MGMRVVADDYEWTSDGWACFTYGEEPGAVTLFAKRNKKSVTIYGAAE